MKSKVLSIFLSLCMMLSLLPTALAAEEAGYTPIGTEPAGDAEDPAETSSGYTFQVKAPERMTVNESQDASVQLISSVDAEPHEHVKILVDVDGPEGSNPQIIANDGHNDYNLAEVGQWGPTEGFPVAAGYDETTDLKLTFDKAGSYRATFQLVEVTNETTPLAEGTASVTVVEQSSGTGTAEDPFTSVAAYNAAVDSNELDGEDVYLTIRDTSFDAGEFALKNVQNRTNPPKLHLTLTNCQFTGNTSGDSVNSSFLYLSNCQEFVMDGCTFDTGDTALKYGINWNLIQIKEAKIDIRDCSFTGTYEKNALKLNQRNGADDTADDVNVDGEFPASICSASIVDCTFDGQNAIIQLGSAGKGKDGAAAPSTGAFPVTIQASEESGVVVELAYQMSENDESKTVELKAGETGSKAAEGDFDVTAPHVTGVEVVGEDGFTPVTNPMPGQKLTANIQTNRGVIGSYPLRPDAHYKWYYQDSTDTILGTEPVYTVTSDNAGRVLCVAVSVDDYEGEAVWSATAPVGQYAITASAGNGGTISPSGTVNVDAGKNQTFSITAKSAYYISDVIVDGVSQGRLDTYTFENVTDNHTISAVFTRWAGTSSGGGSGSIDYAITVEETDGGSLKVSPTRASKGETVTITVTPDTGYQLDELTVSDKNGETVELTDKGDDTYTFLMPSGKVTVTATFVAAEAPDASDLPFYDVPENAYYYDAVKWAVEQGITSGTSATTFAPDMVCTRAQVATFLWRAQGSPAASGSNPFVDVASSSYYADAVLWAVQNDVTSGTSATTFAPDMVCTRAQIVSLLYRALA